MFRQLIMKNKKHACNNCGLKETLEFLIESTVEEKQISWCRGCGALHIYEVFFYDEDGIKQWVLKEVIPTSLYHAVMIFRGKTVNNAENLE